MNFLILSLPSVAEHLQRKFDERYSSAMTLYCNSTYVGFGEGTYVEKLDTPEWT